MDPNENEMNNVAQYLDSLVTTINPDNEPNEIVDEKDEETLEDDDDDDVSSRNAIIDSPSDLGLRNMDRSYDWINEARQRYSNTDFLEADTFVSRVSINWQGNNVLNTDHRIERTAGNGKTYFNNEIRSRLQVLSLMVNGYSSYIVIDEKNSYDFGQPPSVLDLPMYTNIPQDQLFNNGVAAYHQFKEAYKLDVVQRQSGNTKRAAKL
ncbi:hypothetical protein RhiirA4_464807 [Rhizophagus irregularis]|uniref:Uncharacterized protein n=1 Tax=Rhizophagus irregularis TaxID=588596 RepID=A0A2I1GQV8_9GLOM|nr:hypothetical protein RhiirA4_464807 [Rhizophagus irregularis]